MTFTELLSSPVFFNTFIKNNTLFNSLKEKFPEILADLTSSRNNPNCSCKNRVKAHLQSKIETEAEYFNSLLNNEEIKNIINEKAEEIKNTQAKDPLQEHVRMIRESMFKNGGGRVFEIGKTEQDWKNLCKKLELEKIVFKCFSVLEKQDKLMVYFI